MPKLKRERIAHLPWCSATKEDLQAAVQCLRDNFTVYVGPFVTKSGSAVFKVSGHLLTADELVTLHTSGQLTPEGVSKYAKDLAAGEDRVAG